MTYKVIYFIVTLILAGSGSLVFWKIRNESSTNTFKFRKNRYEEVKSIIRSKFDEQAYEQIFKRAGLNITVIQYEVTRYIVLIVWVIMLAFVNRMNLKNIIGLQLLIAFAVFWAATPKTIIFGKKTPFMYIMDLLTKEFNQKKNVEVYRAILQLKNMSKVQQNNPYGALFIFEQLRKFTKITRPIFNRMIALYSEDKRDQAYEYFQKAMGTREGEELGNILMKLDKLSPAELRTQLEMYQDSIKRERDTNRKKRNDNRSYAVYFMVVSSTILILINFVIVVFYLDTMKAFQIAF